MSGTGVCHSCKLTGLCDLCALLAYGWGDGTLTKEQEDAAAAYMESDEEKEGPLYQAMVAAGLPKWGERKQND